MSEEKILTDDELDMVSGGEEEIDPTPPHIKPYLDEDGDWSPEPPVPQNKPIRPC